MEKKAFVAALFLALTVMFLPGCNRNVQVADTTAAPFSLDSFFRISGEVTDISAIDGIEQTIYRIDDAMYGIFITYDGVDYFLGESMSDGVQLEKTPLSYMKESVYSWVEVRGAAYCCTRYMSFRDGQPVMLADIDGAVYYEDLNGDGSSELIAASTGSLPPFTDVYFWDSGEYGGATKISLCDALGVYSVGYDGECFIIRDKQKGEERRVKLLYDGEGFVEAG